MFLLWANRLPKQRLANGLKKLGEAVAMDEPLVELETDKVTVEVPSPVAGKLSEIIAKEGDTVEVKALLGTVEAGQAGVSQSFSPSVTPVPEVSSESEKLASSSAMPPSPSAAKLMAENNVAKVIFQVLENVDKFLKKMLLVD